jgi:hypothetical protein
VKAARGTMVAMVGTGASCQQKWVLMMFAPAASTAWPRDTISSQARPPSSMSIAEMRKITMKRAHGGAHPADHLDREAHAVLPRPAPAVGAQVGLLDQEGRLSR